MKARWLYLVLGMTMLLSFKANADFNIEEHYGIIDQSAVEIGPVSLSVMDANGNATPLVNDTISLGQTMRIQAQARLLKNVNVGSIAIIVHVNQNIKILLFEPKMAALLV